MMKYTPDLSLACLQSWLELAELAGVCLESGVSRGARGEGGGGVTQINDHLLRDPSSAK